MLLFLKPDAFIRCATTAKVLGSLRRLGACPDVVYEYRINRELAVLHYDNVRERPFFGWLIDYVTCAPSYIGFVEVDQERIAEIRSKVGDTLVQRAKRGTIRRRFGIYGGINAIHISDSVQSAVKELNLWKPVLAGGELKGLRADALIASYVKYPDLSAAIKAVGHEIIKNDTAELDQCLKALLQAESGEFGKPFVDDLLRVTLQGILREH